MSFNDTYWMRQAYQCALIAESQHEVPVGAVVVSEKNELIASGWNQVIQSLDPSAHAEMVAIRHAARHKKNYRLLNCTLYVTLEPCCMCAGLLIQARIKRLVYATRDVRFGAAGSVYNLVNSALSNHKIQIDDGLLQKECAALLSRFFL